MEGLRPTDIDMQGSIPVSSIEITTSDISRETRQSERYYQQPQQRRILRQQANQIHTDEVRAAEQSPCTAADPNFAAVLAYHLPSLRADQLLQLLRDQFINPEVMRMIACVIGALYSVHTAAAPTQTAQLDRLERLRYWLHDLRQIGAESVEGYALRSNLDTAPNAFILKVPRSPRGSLLHEYIVGLTGTNSLRTLIPNYAYILGSFGCSPPFISRGSNDQGRSSTTVVGWCNSEEPDVGYLVYENIVPSRSMADYVAQCTFDQFLNAYVQVLLAIQVGYEVIDFTHYDLHDENVLLREGPPDQQGRPFTLAFPTRQGTYYVTANLISTLIDFGFAHVRTTQGNFGVTGVTAYGVRADSGYPLFDAYKLLGMSMRTMLRSGNRQCFKGAAQLFAYFNRQEDPATAIERQSEFYYSLPRLPQLARRDLIDFINYIQARFQPTFLTQELPSGGRLLSCSQSGVNCLRAEAVLDRLGLRGMLHVDRLFKLAQIISDRGPQHGLPEPAQVSIDFNVDTALQAAYGGLQRLLLRDQQQLNDLRPVNFGRIVNQRYNPAFFRRYIGTAYQIAQLTTRLQQAHSLLKAMTLVGQAARIDIAPFSVFYRQILQLRDQLQQHVDRLRADVSSLTQRPNPEYSWYWDVLPVLVETLDETLQAID